MFSRIRSLCLTLLTGTCHSRSRSRSRCAADDDEKKTRWIKRYRPTPHMLEIGIFGGIFMPTKRIELFQPDRSLPDQGQKSFKPVAPDIGLRFGYYPLRFFGAELEGAVMPTKLRSGDDRATIWGFRGHVVGQLGLWSVTPFILLGTGALGVTSPRSSVGKDTDIAIHFGGGVKIWVHRLVQLRVDLRDNVTATSWRRERARTLGRGVVRRLVHAAARQGERGRTEGSRRRRLPRRRGQVPARSRHRAGRLSAQGHRRRRLLRRRGQVSEGARRRARRLPASGQATAIKIADDVDKCPDIPETKNGYQDTDGCKDELPKEVEDFSGVLQGIEFDLDRDTIKKLVVAQAGQGRQGAQGPSRHQDRDRWPHRLHRLARVQPRSVASTCAIREGLLLEEGHQRRPDHDARLRTRTSRSTTTRRPRGVPTTGASSSSSRNRCRRPAIYAGRTGRSTGVDQPQHVVVLLGERAVEDCGERRIGHMRSSVCARSYALCTSDSSRSSGGEHGIVAGEIGQDHASACPQLLRSPPVFGRPPKRSTHVDSSRVCVS